MAQTVYTPPPRPGVEPQLRSCSSRRSRLWAGGTYFRSRAQGLQQNRISVQVIEFQPPAGPTGEANPNADGICVVTNHNILFDENVTGPATPLLLKMGLAYNQEVRIRDLNTIPRAQIYSISAQIAPAPPVVADLGNLSFSSVFHIPSLLSVRLTPGASEFTPTDEIIIKPRTRVYRLHTVSTTDTGTGLQITGWDIDALRSAINASDPWVEMPERSTQSDDGSGGVVTIEPADVQDTEADAAFLSPFGETFLSGGDGLPDTPNNEATGPTKALVHVNYSETDNGDLAELNVVFEWVGTSASEGSWRRY